MVKIAKTRTSRIGRKPIVIIAGVTVKIDGNRVTVAGPKGEVVKEFSPQITISLADGRLTIVPKVLNLKTQALWGTTRALLANMIDGAAHGCNKTLKLVGTGYRVKIEGEKLVMALGYSHPVVFAPVVGVKFLAPDDVTIKIDGADLGLVTQIAAKIKSLRPPEPYKGKGIRYENEVITKKAGKAGKAGVSAYGAGGKA